jgi:hypothetical protein
LVNDMARDPGRDTRLVERETELRRVRVARAREGEWRDVLAGAAALAAPALAVTGADQQPAPAGGCSVVHGLFSCIANLGERGPLLLALDDAHWFDAPSLRFLRYLARRVADLPVAMILATRLDEPGPEPQLVQQLTLEPGAEILRRPR